LLVELLDHLSGRVFRRTDPIPLARLVARHEFGQGRNIRQHIRTGRSCHRQRAQHAAPDVLDARGYGAENDLHLSAQQIGNVTHSPSMPSVLPPPRAPPKNTSKMGHSSKADCAGLPRADQAIAIIVSGSFGGEYFFTHASSLSCGGTSMT